jgi:transposase-like protein
MEVSVSEALLPGLLGKQEGLAKLAEAALNQVLEAQVTEALGAARHVQGASWQRCQVHLMCNILWQVSGRQRAELASAVKLVLQAPDLAEARRRLAEFAERFAKSAPRWPVSKRDSRRPWR